MFTSDVVIGLEIHVELKTESKLFCGCSTDDRQEPNTLTCPICLGFPGSKPVVNEKAILYALKLALALDCHIAPSVIFSRKTYFYPDLSKNYQITQFEIPLGKGGSITLTDGKVIVLRRVHLEEDPGALVHPGGTMAKSPYTLIDYNRSGHPLCEVVTEPVLESAVQARELMKTLLTIVRSLKIFDPQRCTIKGDANVSIKESGYTRVEIKNIGSFKDMETAIEYEVARQRKAMRDGEAIIQETRGYDTKEEKTITLRKKESEDDYGYITDPDLVPIPLATTLVEAVRSELPLSPFEQAHKLMAQGVSEEDARVLSAEYDLSVLHGQLCEAIDPLLAARIVRRDIPRILNYHKLGMELVDGDIVKEILLLFKEKKVTEKTMQKLLEEYSNCLAAGKSFSPAHHVKTHGLEALADTGELEKMCRDVIAQNPKAVEDYKGGNEASFNFLLGQVMRASRGKSDPAAIKESLLRLLRC